MAEEIEKIVAKKKWFTNRDKRRLKAEKERIEVYYDGVTLCNVTIKMLKDKESND